MTNEQTDAVRALVTAAIELAVYRHDLHKDDEELSDEEVADIAADVFGALQGTNTCAEEPCEEWVAIEAAFYALSQPPGGGR